MIDSLEDILKISNKFHSKNEPLVEGIQLTLKSLLNILSKLGVKIEGQEKELNMLRAKYLAKILLISYNESKKELLKAATAYSKKQSKSSKIIINNEVKVNGDLMNSFKKKVLMNIF